MGIMFIHTFLNFRQDSKGEKVKRVLAQKYFSLFLLLITADSHQFKMHVKQNTVAWHRVY